MHLMLLNIMSVVANERDLIFLVQAETIEGKNAFQEGATVRQALLLLALSLLSSHFPELSVCLYDSRL